VTTKSFGSVTDFDTRVPFELNNFKGQILFSSLCFQLQNYLSSLHPLKLKLQRATLDAGIQNWG